MNALALDLGGTKIAARFTSGDAVINKAVDLPMSGCPQRETAFIRDFLKPFIQPDIAGAALASAPTIDDDGTILRWPNRSYWEGFPLKVELESIIGCPLIVEDDGNAAALAEASAMHVKNLVFISLGTGVGGGIIIDGEVYHGHTKKAAELGHMLVSIDDRKCPCGRTGCLQAYASGRALMHQLFPESHESPTTFELKSAIAANSEKARAAIEMAAVALARAIISLSEILEPQLFSIGGGLGANVPELIHKTKHIVSTLLRRGQEFPAIHMSIHGPWASLEGADILAKKHTGIRKKYDESIKV